MRNYFCADIFPINNSYRIYVRNRMITVSNCKEFKSKDGIFSDINFVSIRIPISRRWCFAQNTDRKNITDVRVKNTLQLYDCVKSLMQGKGIQQSLLERIVNIFLPPAKFGAR